MKEAGGHRRGLAEDIYKSGSRQLREKASIHGNTSDHLRSSAVRKKRTQDAVMGNLMFSHWVEDQQQPGTWKQGTAENHTMTPHGVKGVEMLRAVPGTECGYNCCCGWCLRLLDHKGQLTLGLAPMAPLFAWEIWEICRVLEKPNMKMLS